MKSVTGDHLHETYDGEQSIAVEGETILEQLHEFSDEDGFYLNAWAGTAQSIVNNIQAFQAEMKAADLKAQQAKAAAQPQDGAHDPSKDRESADQNMEMNKAVMAKFEADIEALVEKWVDDLLGNRQEKSKSQTSPAPKAEHILKKQTPAFPKKAATSPEAQKLLSWQGAYELGIESVGNPWDLFLGPVRMAKAAIFGTQWLKNKITSALAKSLSKRHVKDAPSMAKRVVERAAQSKDRWADWRLPKSDLDKKALDAAQKGAGDPIMGNLKDPRYAGMEKYRYVQRSVDGKSDVAIHYIKDPKTGKSMDFKFQKRSDGTYYKKDSETGLVDKFQK